MRASRKAILEKGVKGRQTGEIVRQSTITSMGANFSKGRQRASKGAIRQRPPEQARRTLKKSKIAPHQGGDAGAQPGSVGDALLHEAACGWAQCVYLVGRVCLLVLFGRYEAPGGPPRNVQNVRNNKPPHPSKRTVRLFCLPAGQACVGLS